MPVAVGTKEGALEGTTEDRFISSSPPKCQSVGNMVGAKEGALEGMPVDQAVALAVGMTVGVFVGEKEGAIDGTHKDRFVSFAVGMLVGEKEGALEGTHKGQYVVSLAVLDVFVGGSLAVLDVFVGGMDGILLGAKLGAFVGVVSTRRRQESACSGITGVSVVDGDTVPSLDDDETCCASTLLEACRA